MDLIGRARFCNTELGVVTVRLPDEIERKLKMYKVSVSETVRGFLEKYLDQLEKEDLAKRLDDVKEKLQGKINSKLIAKLVRD